MHYLASPLAGLLLSAGGSGDPRVATSSAALAPSPAFGLTEIVAIVNKSGGEVYFLNNENGHSVRVKPGATMMIKEYVPWCTSHKDYEARHHINVVVYANGAYPQKAFWMWQSNENWQDRIRSFDRIWWKPQATPVAGDSGVDGERVLEINADGTPSLRKP